MRTTTLKYEVRVTYESDEPLSPDDVEVLRQEVESTLHNASTCGELDPDGRAIQAYTLEVSAPNPSHSPSAVLGELVAWTGWGCQYPGKMPRLYGDRRLAELNCDWENGDQVLYFTAAPQPADQQTAPAVQGEPVYLYRRRGFRSFETCNHVQFAELSAKPRLFETKVLYTAPQTAEQPDPTDAQILAITTAYEQGVGKGHEAHHWCEEIQNPYGASGGCDKAWQMGYEEGKEQAANGAKRSAAKPRPAPDVTQLVGALEQIERWDGFPSTEGVWEDSGEPVSYGAAFGSNGERDFMREVARKALAAHRKQGG